jgi:erythrin-vacuolar iron transport family protein
LTALMERLGLGGREMTTSGHSKDLVLKVVQPSLVGLMDGSVSTLAPLFATAFATGEPRITFLVGLAAAVGAAISMGFSEGLSDDGSLTGRGHPCMRGAITGVATFIGGILHTLPFLIPHVNLALYVAFGVVGFELLAISFIRYRYFRMSFVLSTIQVVVGGMLVFLAGIFIGSA